jgi:hypothetical protein
MSSQRFEAFLARLYSEREFLDEFMRAPERATREMGLDAREEQAALTIDRAGLLMAARSYELKREQRRAGRRVGSCIRRYILQRFSRY